MEAGIILGDVRTSVPPREHFRDLLVQVEAAQRNGFTYVAIGQHFLYGDFRWLQPIPTLARLAGELDAHVRLAATVIIVPLHHPVVLAEELATLDIVSEGRLVVGAGLGYRKEEFRLLGVDFAERVPRFEEALELIVQLWTADRVTHEGRFWTLDDATTHVRPVQQPHPPLWLGAHSDAGVRRAARLGSTWMIPAECPLEDVRRWIGLFQETRAAHGLPPAERFPIRRELAVGRDREDALRVFERSASGRYRAYAVRERAWAGTEAELLRHLRRAGRRSPRRRVSGGVPRRALGDCPLRSGRPDDLSPELARHDVRRGGRLSRPARSRGRPGAPGASLTGAVARRRRGGGRASGRPPRDPPTGPRRPSRSRRRRRARGAPLRPARPSRPRDR